MTDFFKPVTLIFFLLLISNLPAHAISDKILITVTPDSDKIIIDGRWSFETEWKASSENFIAYKNGERFSIRSAHDYDNLYFLIDFVSDTKLTKHGDRAVICFDVNLDKNKIPSQEDICILISLGSENPIILRGGSLLLQKGFWTTDNSISSIVAAGSVSSPDNRYSSIPHASYEFKIPLEVLTRSDIYGFYVQLYDANTAEFYSWPADTISDQYPFIATPDKWGELVSPDKTIPEFLQLELVFISSFAVLLFYITKRKRCFEQPNQVK